MADPASEKLSDGFWNFLVTLGFISPLLGAEEFVRPYVFAGPALQWWVCAVLVVVGLPLHQSKAIWIKLRPTPLAAILAPLGYLHSEDADLGGAIRDMAWRSAWGKWFAAQSLATNNHHPASEADLMHIAAHLVGDAVMDGRLEVRGRRPGQMNYEPIPRTHWRSSALHMIPDNRSLWRMVIIPRGGAEVEPNGNVIGHDPVTVARTGELTAYDSLLVSGRQFEKLWPRKDKATDAARKVLLKKAKKAKADPAEIAKLSRG